MPIGVGAQEIVGIAAEVTPGTYLAPTVWLPLRSETFKYVQDTVWRRPLRGIADIAGPVPGNSHIEGDFEIECTEDILPSILRHARGAQVKTGATPSIYTYTPSAVAIPAKTASISVSRAGVVFGYTGCIISSMEYSMDNGLLIAKFSILGQDEATQTALTPTYTLTPPFGAGQYSLEIPSGSPVLDTDGFTLTINDAGEAQYRIKNNRYMQFAKYGERTVVLKVARDFQDRTEYDAFKALTAKEIKLTASKPGGTSISFDIKAAIVDTYEIGGTTGQGDLVRADITYNGVYDNTSSAPFQIVSTTNATITVP
jgi:hypothetical protein